MLAFPIIFQKYLMGAIELMNRRTGDRFTEDDEGAVADLSKIIGIALYNQKRLATRSGRKTKFDYLLENHLLTQKELTKAVADAHQRKEATESILIREYKIPKTEVGESLSRYFKVPFVAYNNSFPIPGDLLSGLKVPFMRNNVWVPLRADDGDPMIAIDDPHDLKRIDEIKALFPGRQAEVQCRDPQAGCPRFHQAVSHRMRRKWPRSTISFPNWRTRTQEIEEAEGSIGGRGQCRGPAGE